MGTRGRGSKIKKFCGCHITNAPKVYCDHRDFVDLCPVRKLTLHSPSAALSERPLLPKFGMLWRFSPIADPLVAEFHSRDLDSRPTGREWAAVEEWLQVGNSIA